MVNYFKRYALLKKIMKEKLLFITGPNKILSPHLYIVFLYADFYSILANFHSNKITNQNHMNSPNEHETFMRECIHKLGVQTCNACALISSCPSRRTTDIKAMPAHECASPSFVI